jgi:uncharacterized protein YciI
MRARLVRSSCGALFLVGQARRPTWDPSRGRREQSGWNEHVAFTNRLSDDGNIALGGPIGDVDGQHVVLVVPARSKDEACAIFADDPWRDRMLRMERSSPGRSGSAPITSRCSDGARKPARTCTCAPGIGRSSP